MTDPSLMYAPMTSTGSRNATSSPVSVYGATHCAELDGPMTDLFGQALALANRSASPAKVGGMKTSATYGRLGSGSSESAALQERMASKLQALTASRGSMLFRLTWKVRVTPSGRRICALRASGRPTSGSGFSSSGRSLVQQSAMAHWPTPNARDFKHGPQQTYSERGGGAKGDSLGNLVTAVLAGWPTPMAGSSAKPATATSKGYNAAGNNDFSRRVVELASGPKSNGSPAATARAGQLNPELPRWLLGLPPTWGDSAPGNDAWQRWQALMQWDSLEPRHTGSEP